MEFVCRSISLTPYPGCNMSFQLSIGGLFPILDNHVTIHKRFIQSVYDVHSCIVKHIPLSYACYVYLL